MGGGTFVISFISFFSNREDLGGVASGGRPWSSVDLRSLALPLRNAIKAILRWQRRFHFSGRSSLKFNSFAHRISFFSDSHGCPLPCNHLQPSLLHKHVRHSDHLSCAKWCVWSSQTRCIIAYMIVRMQGAQSLRGCGSRVYGPRMSGSLHEYDGSWQLLACCARALASHRKRIGPNSMVRRS